MIRAIGGTVAYGEVVVVYGGTAVVPSAFIVGCSAIVVAETGRREGGPGRVSLALFDLGQWDI